MSVQQREKKRKIKKHRAEFDGEKRRTRAGGVFVKKNGTSIHFLCVVHSKPPFPGLLSPPPCLDEYSHAASEIIDRAILSKMTKVA